MTGGRPGLEGGCGGGPGCVWVPCDSVGFGVTASRSTAPHIEPTTRVKERAMREALTSTLVEPPSCRMRYIASPPTNVSTAGITAPTTGTLLNPVSIPVTSPSIANAVRTQNTPGVRTASFAGSLASPQRTTATMTDPTATGHTAFSQSQTMGFCRYGGMGILFRLWEPLTYRPGDSTSPRPTETRGAVCRLGRGRSRPRGASCPSA